MPRCILFYSVDLTPVSFETLMFHTGVCYFLGCLRWCICLHATWTVNSTAHIWGDRRYCVEGNPCESCFTALVAVGEGWHDWHHKYPYDYAAAEGGVWDQYNPSKLVGRHNILHRRTSRQRKAMRYGWPLIAVNACDVHPLQFIDCAAWFGMAWDRRRATTAWQMLKAEREQHIAGRQQREADARTHCEALAAVHSLREVLRVKSAKTSTLQSLVRAQSTTHAGVGLLTAHYGACPSLV